MLHEMAICSVLQSTALITIVKNLQPKLSDVYLFAIPKI